MQLVIATHNVGKVHEFRDLLHGIAGISVSSLDEYPEATEPEETGATFRDNALLKARAASEATGHWVLADDSGLCVDALGGRPGVQSARYATGSDDARWQKLLGELANTPDADRSAAFVCAICLYGPGGENVIEEGRCEGRIARAPRGAHGFGYDPVFVVGADPAGRTMAELSTAEKRAVSHRGKAFAALRAQLQRLLRG